MLFILYQKLFSFSRSLNFCLDFLVTYKKRLDIEQGYLSKNVKNFKFLGNLMIISTSLLDFSIESIYEWLCLIDIYSPENENKHCSEMRSQHQSSNLAERFLHNLCLCFHIVFVQLEVITRTRNNFVEIVTVTDRYLFIQSCKI